MTIGPSDPTRTAAIHGDLFQVRLRNTPTYDLQTQRRLEQFAEYPLNQRQRRILAYARQHGNMFTNRAYQKVSEVDHDLAYREIQEIIGLGTVTRPSGRYGRTYSVVEPVTARPLPDELALILDTLSTQGYVTNQDLREAWRVSRTTAWRRVKELITEGFLRQEGEKRSVRYYPTAKLQDVLENA